MTPLTTILTPCGMLGYSYPVDDFWATVQRGVDAIVVDAGSTDPGPYQLALGATLVTEDAYARDLLPLLQAADRGTPVLISSAGGAGTREQVDAMVALIDRLCSEQGLTLRVGVIYAEVPRPIVAARLADGRVEPNVRGELPNPADIDASPAVVAQMGAAPFRELLDREDPPQAIVSGRAYDPAPHAAWAMRFGVDPGIAWHMGKILECGGACAEPKGGGVLARVWADAFELEPMSPGQRCTPLSVAAHTLYEKRRPDRLPGPDGVLDVSASSFTAVDERTVRVAGSRHLTADRPTLKLEAGVVRGQRAVFIGAVRDPILVGQIDHFLDRVRQTAGALLPDIGGGEATLNFHVYGRDGAMGPLEPSPVAGHEIAILAEVTAPTAERAKAICTMVRVGVLHLPYEGQIATAGNLALPLSPMENVIGPACAFSLYHVMDAAGLELFPTAVVAVGTSERVAA